MKHGRNDPCPCGSGKKYKHCCLNQPASAPSPAELTRRRVRREMGGVADRMLRFTTEVYGPAALDEAWSEFMLWDEGEEVFDPESPHLPIFMPWLLHRWSPDPDETEVTDADLIGKTPGQTYLRRKGWHMASLVQRYLQSCQEQPFSFYQLEQTDPGRSMTLRDVLTGAQHTVHERAASQSLQPHDIIFAQLAHVDDITLLEATSPIAFEPHDKITVVDLRQRMRDAKSRENPSDPEPGIEELREWELELRELYLGLAEPLLFPTRPDLVTTDGEAIEFHKLIYDIDSAQIAFEALRHLDPRLDDADAARASLIAEGSADSVSIDWLKESDDREAASRTVLGTLTIDKSRLIAEFNSRERAERFRTIVEDRLAAHARFRMDEVRAAWQTIDDGDPQSASGAQAPLPDDPEVQALIVKHLREHYLQWIDSGLPALGHRTPREVAQSADGREQVDALLQSAEQVDLGLTAASRNEIFYDIRQRLGLRD